MKEYKINEFITLKLENRKTVIYVKGKIFIQCMRLVLQISERDIEEYHDIDSIDDAIEIYNSYLYENTRIIQQILLTRRWTRNPMICNR